VLKLEVTPHITPDDRMIMDLEVNKDNPDFANPCSACRRWIPAP
jgi:type II secretory pathway component HofQ